MKKIKLVAPFLITASFLLPIFSIAGCSTEKWDLSFNSLNDLNSKNFRPTTSVIEKPNSFPTDDCNFLVGKLDSNDIYNIILFSTKYKLREFLAETVVSIKGHFKFSYDEKNSAIEMSMECNGKMKENGEIIGFEMKMGTLEGKEAPFITMDHRYGNLFIMCGSDSSINNAYFYDGLQFGNEGTYTVSPSFEAVLPDDYWGWSY